MTPSSAVICAIDQVVERGKGVRFSINIDGKPREAFLIRFHGKFHAFLNSCPHMGTELDWQPGEFFDMSGLYLICATHGAVFLPETGDCTGGPCKGRRLIRLPVIERDGAILLDEGFNLYVE
jgi:nitrite reductase/ring-hydroxylating ferredoxin subunit